MAEPQPNDDTKWKDLFNKTCVDVKTYGESTVVMIERLIKQVATVSNPEEYPKRGYDLLKVMDRCYAELSKRSATLVNSGILNEEAKNSRVYRRVTKCIAVYNKEVEARIEGLVTEMSNSSTQTYDDLILIKKDEEDEHQKTAYISYADVLAEIEEEVAGNLI